MKHWISLKVSVTGCDTVERYGQHSASFLNTVFIVSNIQPYTTIHSIRLDSAFVIFVDISVDPMERKYLCSST